MEKFNIDKYVNEKIASLKNSDKTFKSIFELMFRDEDNVMFEWTDGSRIKKMTYGQCKIEIDGIARGLNEKLKKVKKGTMVGIYAQNSVKWVQVFWAILKCGYQPILLNTRLDKNRLVDTLKPYEVSAIISDGEDFGKKTINIDEIENIKDGENVECFENKIIVMSSGTTLDAKLCVYDGESFYYQLLDSADIIKTCKQIKKHYEGSLKQLMFLPLYHIFGLAAMFMWFAFFSRTFVLLKDQNPETILFTIRKHKVTHIFAVPLFWETVYKKFKAVLKTQDEKTIKKAEKGLRLVKKLKSLWLGRKLFKPVRDKIFGESVCFLISGGSAISSEILTFFNSIGYQLANGYGMSEIGIASVELTSSFKNLTDCSVGRPFGHYQYRLDNNGCLYVKGQSMAKEIYINGKLEEFEDGWYKTLDMAKEENGRYFICGRQDDMIVGVDGENINPAWVEKQIKIDKVEDVCILKLKGRPTLLIQISKFMSLKNLDELRLKAREELVRVGVGSVIQSIEFTRENFISGNDFKVSRNKLQNIKLIEDVKEEDIKEEKNEIKKRLKELFKAALNREEEIKSTDHFFFDLNGNSLDYFSLLSSIQNEFGISFPQEEGKCLYTVKEFFDYIQKNN